jgi:hypothetical protein
MSRGVEISLAGFALAIVLLLAAPLRVLSQRVALLEHQMAPVTSGPSSVADHTG